MIALSTDRYARAAAMRPGLHVALRVMLCAISLMAGAHSAAVAQGVTSATIRGAVQGLDGHDIGAAQVVVVQRATGHTYRGEVRRGVFQLHGLESGGPYTVRLEQAGYHPAERDDIRLELGEVLELHFVLHPVAVPLDTVRAFAAQGRRNPHGGTATIVSDSLLHRLPALDRNLYDFVRLAPQVSTRIGFAGGGMSAAGAGFRLNSFVVDGVSQRTLSGGVPLEFAGLRSVPLDAVREYQVLIAPFDVRYGDFAGALVNAVTRSGTNRIQATAFGLARSDRLAAAHLSASPYERLQYGATLAGPVLRDRLLFLVAAEMERLTSPAPGPYVGQPDNASTPVPVAEQWIAGADSIFRDYGLVSGTGAAVGNDHPVGSLFVRLDLHEPSWRTRATLSYNEARSSNLSFSRIPSEPFLLTTFQARQRSAARTAAVRVRTTFGSDDRASTELVVSARAGSTEWQPAVRQPVIRVVVPTIAGTAAELVTGAPPQAHGVTSGFSALSARNDVVIGAGSAHVVRAGAELERFDVLRSGLPNAYGTWRFSSLDALARGSPNTYEATIDRGAAQARLEGAHYSAWVGDEWRISSRLSMTLGVRGDLLALHRPAPRDATVDSIFSRRTDQLPRQRLHVAPRVGFVWEPAFAAVRLRGGVGIFTGRPPLGWLHAALYSYGSGSGTIRCGPGPLDAGPAPAFRPDADEPPGRCANDAGPAPGDVNLLASGLRMPQSLRAVIAVERNLSAGVTLTGEAVLTRMLSDYVVVNMNLAGPQGTDANGRVLYGSLNQAGVALPALRSNFAEVIDLRNTARNHAVQLSAGMERRFTSGSAVVAHYTWTRARDVQTLLRIGTVGTVNWSLRPVAHRHDDLRTGISLNDIPHRVVVAGTQRAPWRRWTTELSFQYIGEAGSPFTYIVGGVQRRGDLNADGSATNDPVYVPLSAFDTTEIRFSGVAEGPTADNSPEARQERIRQQQAAFHRFIERTPCLRSQRGRMVERNSCREPWSHTTAATLRQAIPVGSSFAELQVDVYNVLNLLSRDWGLQRTGRPRLLEHVGQSAGPPTQPVFRFVEPLSQWDVLPSESAFQLQLGLRYRF